MIMFRYLRVNVLAVSNKSKLQTNPHQVQQGKGTLVAHREETLAIHSGPIPTPDIIDGYEKVLPGSANRIIKMAELEQTHQHQYVNRGQLHVFVVTVIGQISGALLGMAGVVGGVFLVFYNKPITGFSVFFTSLGALVGIFVYQKWRKKPESPK